MIAIASDHGGYDLKAKVIAHLKENGLEVKDYGCYSTASCDYPDFIRPAAQAVASGEAERGIVICTTGIGVSIVCNRIPGIRCALCTSVTMAHLTREHNDSNILALGAGITGEILALDIVDTWLNTEFSHMEKHQRRINKIEG